MPPHEGLGTRHCGGIESPQVGMTRKDGIADANDCEKSRRDRKGAKPRPLCLLASAYAFFSKETKFATIAADWQRGDIFQGVARHTA
jgi:hypothetical protein